MIKLEKEFQSGVASFSTTPLTYKLLIRNENHAVYERSFGGKVKDYETITIKIRPKGFKIFESVQNEDEEIYPSTGQWGKFGWSYLNKGAALNKFEELSKTKVIPEAAEIEIPDGEFRTVTLMELNSINYITAYNYIKENLNKTIKFVREQSGGRGKPSKYYSKI